LLRDSANLSNATNWGKSYESEVGEDISSPQTHTNLGGIIIRDWIGEISASIAEDKKSGCRRLEENTDRLDDEVKLFSIFTSAPPITYLFTNMK
jgi:hypothetical protein